MKIIIVNFKGRIKDLSQLSNMGNQSKNSSGQNIVIKKVTDSTIKLDLNGEMQEISNDITELKNLMQLQGQTTFQAGEKIYNIREIGQAEFKTIINQYHQESKRSYYLRVFLMVFVPILAIAGAYWLYQYQSLQKPLSLTVKLKNLSPNPELASPQGKLILTFGDKSDVQDIGQTETLFKGIPANFRKHPVQLSFDAAGFEPKDTGFLIDGSTIILSVIRNNGLGKIIGTIHDEQNKPLDGVKISVQDLNTYTDNSGHFLLSIPFEKQRPRQRLEVFKAGYRKKDVETPVIPNEMVRLILEKNKKP
jgi:hypothetical protein